ncbi:hypothetical protein [Streptomyces sp. b94]|uniref:hypothetical protein n=1 Tax=Streptomyces sp. b94 TaxID=1827634 RepID=UPI001FFC2F21|nr:hypothetical protein [Streptomyces sp. b94]
MSRSVRVSLQGFASTRRWDGGERDDDDAGGGPLTRAHLEDFVQCYRPDEDRSKRVETERFKAYTYEELVARDKANLDITWLRDPSLDDAGNLPAPEVLAAEIVEDLQAALEEFAAIAETLQQARGEGARAEETPVIE